MADTYTSNIRLRKMETGTSSGTWGTNLNSNALDMVDEAFGYVEVNAAGSGNITLTSNNGSADESRPFVVKLTGSRSATGNVVVPTAEKVWIFWNATTGGYALTVKTSGGTGISVPMDAKVVLYADGTNVVDGVNYLVSLTLGTDLAVADGGTGASSAASARSNLGAAASGANSDITSLSALSTALSVAQGGTGGTTASAARTSLGAAAVAGDTFTGQIKLPAFSSVASATTTDLGAVDSNFVYITGTTTITSFGTVAAGTWKVGRFASALTLTYNATQLILPGAANITTAANDAFLAVSLGSGNWIVLLYENASGRAIKGEAILIYEDQKADGTDGGAISTTFSWLTHTLNTEVADTASIGSVSSNQVTLPAGTYEVVTSTVFCSVGGTVQGHRTRWRDITNSVTYALSFSGLIGSTTGLNTNFVIQGRGVFTITSSTVFELQYMVSSNGGGAGLSTQLGTHDQLTAGVEVYANVTLRKLA